MKKNKQTRYYFIRLQELISKHYFETLNYVHMNLEKNNCFIYSRSLRCTLMTSCGLPKS